MGNRHATHADASLEASFSNLSTTAERHFAEFSADGSRLVASELEAFLRSHLEWQARKEPDVPGGELYRAQVARLARCT